MTGEGRFVDQNIRSAIDSRCLLTCAKQLLHLSLAPFIQLSSSTLAPRCTPPSLISTVTLACCSPRRVQQQGAAEPRQKGRGRRGVDSIDRSLLRQGGKGKFIFEIRGAFRFGFLIFHSFPTLI